jgi:hypothetical protein
MNLAVLQRNVVQAAHARDPLNGRHANIPTDVRYESRCQSDREFDASPILPATSVSSSLPRNSGPCIAL